MDVPGIRWLKRQLDGTLMAANGYQAQPPDLVASGAAFAMSVLWVLIWAAAFIPLSVWAAVQWALRRRAS